MATYNKGILGSVHGKVGPVIGSTWKGIDYVRGPSAPRTTPLSELQLAQQARFLLMVKFINSMVGLIRLGFKHYDQKQTPVNAAMSYNIKNAIAGAYPDFVIDYAQVKFSRGDLPGALNASVASAASGVVTFTWDNNAGVGKAQDSDRALLLLYCKARKEAVYVTEGTLRRAGTQDLFVSAFAGEEMHAWMAFISADGKLLSGSSYIGEVLVTA